MLKLIRDLAWVAGGGVAGYLAAVFAVAHGWV